MRICGKLIEILPYLFLIKTWLCLPPKPRLHHEMYAVNGTAVEVVCEVTAVLTSTLASTKDKVDRVDQVHLDPVDAGGPKALAALAHHPSLQNVPRADESPSVQDIIDHIDLHHSLDTTSLDQLRLTIDRVRDQ